MMGNTGSTPEYAVQTALNVWIPVKDGTRLSATIFRPTTNGRFPVIFRCDGYRKDLTRKGELRRIGRYFAKRGYVYVLMDIRGTGDSEGIATDEYSKQELEDAYDAIQWLATQPWSNGAVGMWGKSYSGFNSIQTAMLRPNHLKAIIPIYATDDRYTDDVHYWGGLRHVGSTIPYPLKMIYTNLMPPTPSAHPENWREIWQQRIDQSPPWPLEWWRQQTDGPFWRHGSLRPNYEAINIPVFMVGGWRDGYTNSIPRMLSNMTVPCKALIGPWGHELPHLATIHPQVDFLPMMLRWWDHWLKGKDTGLMNEPAITYYMQDYCPPGPASQISGQWRTLEQWPETADQTTFSLSPGSLSPGPPESADPERLPGSLKLGIGEWKWCMYDPDSLPLDQRAAEPNSLVYSSPPLTEPLELLGQPTLSLTLSASEPEGQIFVRLCDVAPDGRSTHVSWGALNLTHRSSDTDPSRLEPGQPYRVDVELGAVAWRFQPGHVLRLIINNHDWPRLWPSPRLFDLTIHHEPDNLGLLRLPIAPASPTTIVPSPPPAKRKKTADLKSTTNPWIWQLIQERPTNCLRFTLGREEGVEMGDRSLVETTFRQLEVVVPEDQPTFNSMSAYATSTMTWPEVKATVTADLHIASTESAFEFELIVEVFEDDKSIANKTWQETIPRNLV